MEYVIIGGSFVAGALLMALNRVLLARFTPLLIRLRKHAAPSVLIVIGCILASMTACFVGMMALTQWGRLYHPQAGVAFVLGIFVALFEDRRHHSKLG